MAEMRKQSKKAIQSLQMSPRIASLRQGMCEFHFLKIPDRQTAQVISLRQAIMNVYNNNNNNNKWLKSQKKTQCKFKINTFWLQGQCSHEFVSESPKIFDSCPSKTKPQNLDI